MKTVKNIEETSKSKPLFLVLIWKITELEWLFSLSFVIINFKNSTKFWKVKPKQFGAPVNWNPATWNWDQDTLLCHPLNIVSIVLHTASSLLQDKASCSPDADSEALLTEEIRDKASGCFPSASLVGWCFLPPSAHMSPSWLPLHNSIALFYDKLYSTLFKLWL